MPTFENPSHRRHLIELGILSPNESYIAPAELAQRMVSSPHFEEVLYILKQDFAHPVTKYQMLEVQMAMLADEARQITTVDSYLQVLNDLQQLIALPSQIYDLALEMQDVVRILRVEVKDLSLEAQRHLGDMEGFRSRLTTLIIEKESILTQGLADIQQILHQKHEYLKT